MEQPHGMRQSHLMVLSLSLILTGYIGGHYFLLASYFLNSAIFFRITVFIILLTGVGTAYYISQRLSDIITFRIWELYIMLGVFSIFSIHFVYYIRPFTQFTSLFICIATFIFGFLSGLITSHICHISAKHISPKWMGSLSLILLLLLGYWIPVFPDINITIKISSLLLIIIGIISCIREGTNLKPWKDRMVLLVAAIGMTTFTFMVHETLFLYDEQERFEDKVVYTTETDKYEITITQWKDHYWIFQDGLKHLSTIDDYLFYEPFILPVSGLSEDLKRVLILGGENGCATREVLKYQNIESVTIVPYDLKFLELCQNHPILTTLNNNALSHEKVITYQVDILDFITSPMERYDLIILDLPDPRNLESNQFYTSDFYKFCIDLMAPEGYIITQSGSPYFAFEAFRSIESTMRSVGLMTCPLHNQVLTLGEWSWIIGSKNISPEKTKTDIKNLNISNISTKWLNKEALSLIISFGKEYKKIEPIEINSLNNPVAYEYYLRGTWDLD